MHGSPNPDHNCRIQSNHPLISQTGKTDKIGGKKSVRPALNNPSSSYTPPDSATNLSQANSCLQVHQTLSKEILPGQIKPLCEDMFNSNTFLLCSPQSVPTN